MLGPKSHRGDWRTVIDSSDPELLGASLVGILLVLVILGGLATVAVTSLPSGGGLLGRGSSAEPGTSTNVGPGSPIANRGQSLTAAASRAACQADARSIEDAVAEFRAANGAYPQTLNDIAAGRWLSQVPIDRDHHFSLETIGGRPTGRVLVDGRPWADGCHG
jgi:hypothetical protein